MIGFSPCNYDSCIHYDYCSTDKCKTCKYFLMNLKHKPSWWDRFKSMPVSHWEAVE